MANNNKNELDELEMMPTKEEILMNEDDILKGMMEAADYKNDESLQKKVTIKRGDKALFEFIVRPLGEEEINDMRRKCTKKAPNPQGRNLPPIEIETNYVKLRSMKIYEATVGEPGKKIWDNKVLKEKLKTLDVYEVIDSVLLAGEKDAISDTIDSASRYGMNLETYAGE